MSKGRRKHNPAFKAKVAREDEAQFVMTGLVLLVLSDTGKRTAI